MYIFVYVYIYMYIYVHICNRAYLKQCVFVMLYDLYMPVPTSLIFIELFLTASYALRVPL